MHGRIIKMTIAGTQYVFAPLQQFIVLIVIIAGRIAAGRSKAIKHELTISSQQCLGSLQIGITKFIDKFYKSLALAMFDAEIE